MPTCPFCSRDVAAGSRVCGGCGLALVRRCPFCAEEIPVQATACRFCKSDLAAEPTIRPTPGVPSAAPPAGALGDKREIFLSLVLWFVTCGIYGLVMQYKIGAELNAHRRRDELNPGLDVLLLFLTCGIWGIYVHYRYASVLRDLCREEGAPEQDVVNVCLILQILSFCMGGMLHAVSLLILQNEMNRHWEHHGT